MSNMVNYGREQGTHQNQPPTSVEPAGKGLPTASKEPTMNGLPRSTAECASFVGNDSNTSSMQTPSELQCVPKKKKKKAKAVNQPLTHPERLGPGA
jgi:hypothetical protein